MEGISEKKYIMEQGFRLPHKWRDNLGISSRLWSQRDVDTDHLTLQTDGILLVVPAEVMSGGGVLWLSCYHPHAPHCNLTQTSRCGQWGRTGRIPSLLYFLFTPLVELIYPDPSHHFCPSPHSFISPPRIWHDQPQVFLGYTANQNP